MGCTHNEDHACFDCQVETFAEQFEVITLLEYVFNNDPDDETPYTYRKTYKCPICEALVNDALLHTIWHTERGEDLYE
jgi:hypothetical protein